MVLFAIVTILSLFTFTVFNYNTDDNVREFSRFQRSTRVKISSNFTHKNSFGCHLNPHVHEIMTYKCFSENYFLIPRLPQQLAASENLILKIAYTINKITKNGQFLPCGHPDFTDTRYYGKNSNPRRKL